MSVSIAASTGVTVPLNLLVEQEGVGGVPGLTGGNAPLVRIRDGATLNSYVDFGDNFNFKTSGFSQQDQALGEVGGGHYSFPLDLSLITTLAIGNMLVAEYRVNDGGDIVGAGSDLVIIGIQTLASLEAAIALIRKGVTNRLEIVAGNPGLLKLFDDDDSTVILNWEQRDGGGAGIVLRVGSPARRAKAT